VKRHTQKNTNNKQHVYEIHVYYNLPICMYLNNPIKEQIENKLHISLI